MYYYSRPRQQQQQQLCHHLAFAFVLPAHPLSTSPQQQQQQLLSSCLRLHGCSSVTLLFSFLTRSRCNNNNALCCIVSLSHSCCAFMDVRQVLFYSPSPPSTTTTSPVRRPQLIVTALACACRFSRLPMKLADFTEYNALVTHNNDAATLLVSLSHSPHLSCAQDSRTPLCHTRHPVPARFLPPFLVCTWLQPICLICFLAQQLIDITSARTVHLQGVKTPPPLHGGDSAPLLNKVFVNTPPPHHGGDSAPLSSNAFSLLLSTVHLVVHPSPQCCHRLSDLNHPVLPPHRSALVHHIGPGFPFPRVVTARLTLIIQRYRPIDLHSYITLVQAVDILVHLNLPEWPAPATSFPSSHLRCSPSVLCYL